MSAGESRRRRGDRDGAHPAPARSPRPAHIPRELAFIAVGSNLGDRAGHLAQARAELAALRGTRLVAASSIDETAPIGPSGQGPYLNQMIAIETELTPRDLLAELQRIERERGRTRGVRWGPRTLDLDIVRFGERTIDEPDLRVPHPAIPDRDFWRRELEELDRALVDR